MKVTDEQKEVIESIANHVLDHIDTMYPDMWKDVPKTARASIRNTIISQTTMFAAGCNLLQ